MCPDDDTVMGYAAEVTRLLWPPPWDTPQVTRERHQPAPTHRDSYVFPSTRRPRLLLPAEVPGSAAMLQRLGKGRHGITGVARSVLVRCVGSPAFPFLRWPILRVEATGVGSAESIESYLAAHLGVDDVRAGVLLGPRRANQKPVLQVFARDGRLVGYAKIGHNDLTAQLVRREAETLTLLGERRTTAFQAPQLLHIGQWHTLEVLVMSALTGTTGRYTSEGQRISAMREVAHLEGTVVQPLAQSGFWTRLRAQTAEVLDDGVRGRLSSSMSLLQDRCGDAEVELGSWHGDWGHWNMALFGNVVQVWDWERYDRQVPMGFDGLHHRAQRVRPANRDFADQERSFLQAAPAVLAPFGVPRDRADLTVTLYLLEICVRYALAMNHAGTAALRQRSAWVAALLDQRAGAAHDHSGGRRP